MSFKKEAWDKQAEAGRGEPLKTARARLKAKWEKPREVFQASIDRGHRKFTQNRIDETLTKLSAQVEGLGELSLATGLEGLKNSLKSVLDLIPVTKQKIEAFLEK